MDIQTKIKQLMNELGLEYSCRGNGSMLTVDIWFMHAQLVIEPSTNRYEFKLYIDSEFEKVARYERTSFEELRPIVIEVIKQLKPKNPFELKEVGQRIVEKLNKKTGIEYEFIGYDNDALTWDLGIGVSYFKTKQRYGVCLCLNNDNGESIAELSCNDKKKLNNFVNEAISKIKENSDKKEVKKNRKIMDNKSIIRNINLSQKACKELGLRVYEDGCWWIDLDCKPYGGVVFWVGFEDKRNGNYMQSICSIHTYNGEIRYSVDGFKLKKAVENKVISVYKALVKEGLRL